VDLAAPGQYLWSSICRNYVVDDISQLFYILFFEWDGIDPYMRGDGTSFACPITSGVAGLVRTLHPLVPPDFIADHLVATGDFIAFDEPIGPKLNAWRAVSMPVAAADDPSPVLAGAVSVLPQPMRGAGVVRFALPAASHARLEVFDLAGRRVRTLHDGAMAAGEHRQSWDGRDDHGLSLPDGVYLIRLESGSRSAVTRAVLLRR
jgi:hypothetical protein